MANPTKLNPIDTARALKIDCDTYHWSKVTENPSLRGVRRAA